MVGDLDPRFGDEGLINRPHIGTGDPTITRMNGLGSTGRVLLLSDELYEAGRHNVQVTRLNSSGQLDPTYNGDGTAEVRLPVGDEEARDIAVQGSKALILATSRRAANLRV